MAVAVNRRRQSGLMIGVVAAAEPAAREVGGRTHDACTARHGEHATIYNKITKLRLYQSS